MKIKITAIFTLSTGLLVTGFGCTGNSPSTAMKNGAIEQARDNSETRPDAPLTADTHFAAGQVAESQNDFARAIAQYEASIKLDPTASVPLLRMGMIYTNQRHFGQAIDAWNRYIKVTNGSAAGYCDLGYCLEMASRFPEAETAYKTAVQKDGRNEPAHVNYGLMLARLGREDEAAAQLQVVLSPAEAHYNIASVLESQNKKEEARAQYEEALRIDPAMNDARARLAAIELN